MKNLEAFRVTYAFDNETIYTTTLVAIDTIRAIEKFKKGLESEGKSFDSLVAISVINETKRKAECSNESN